MNFGCRPITDDVTKVKIILINNRSEGTFFRISVRFCCSAKASMTSDMTSQTDLWGENL